MSDNRQRTEVVSLRLTPEERERLEQQAAGEPLSTYLRRRSIEPLPVPGCNPHMRAWQGHTWYVEAAPGRTIAVLRGWSGPGIGTNSKDARRLAAALLQAADLAEQSDPDETEDSA